MPRHNRTGLFPKLEVLTDTDTTPARAPAPNAAERDALLSAAIKAGKFREASRSRYAALYDRDPAAAKRLIARLPAAPTEPELASSQQPRRTGLFPKLG